MYNDFRLFSLNKGLNAMNTQSDKSDRMKHHIAFLKNVKSFSFSKLKLMQATHEAIERSSRSDLSDIRKDVKHVGIAVKGALYVLLMSLPALIYFDADDSNYLSFLAVLSLVLLCLVKRMGILSGMLLDLSEFMTAKNDSSYRLCMKQLRRGMDDIKDTPCQLLMSFLAPFMLGVVTLLAVIYWSLLLGGYDHSAQFFEQVAANKEFYSVAMWAVSGVLFIAESVLSIAAFLMLAMIFMYQSSLGSAKGVMDDYRRSEYSSEPGVFVI